MKLPFLIYQKLISNKELFKAFEYIHRVPYFHMIIVIRYSCMAHKLTIMKDDFLQRIQQFYNNNL